MQIFSGKSNLELAGKVAALMGGVIQELDISRFANDETRVRVLSHKIEKEAVLIQSLSSPTNDHIIEFCLICDALHRTGATEITAVVPWLGYSKQDKVFLPGEPLSAKVVAQILQTTKIKKLITFDLHNRAITGFFEIPVVEISAKTLFLEYFSKKINDAEQEDEWVVVAPDEGAVKSSGYFARELGVPVAYIEKRRDLVTGEVEVASMNGSVEGKRVVIVDDMIVTGSTIMETAKYLKQRGAISVFVAATHHLYVSGVQEKLEASEIDEIVVSDSVSNQSQVSLSQNKKLKVLGLDRLIVDELR